MDVFCKVSEILRCYERYVHDLRRLFIFHGLTCGAAEDFSSLARKLESSKALRLDWGVPGGRTDQYAAGGCGILE